MFVWLAIIEWSLVKVLFKTFYSFKNLDIKFKISISDILSTTQTLRESSWVEFSELPVPNRQISAKFQIKALDKIAQKSNRKPDRTASLFAKPMPHRKMSKICTDRKLYSWVNPKSKPKQNDIYLGHQLVVIPESKPKRNNIY